MELEKRIAVVSWLCFVAQFGCSPEGTTGDGGSTAAENTETTCADTLDNDGDELVDCEDSECQGFAFCGGGDGDVDGDSDGDGDGDADGDAGDCVSITVETETVTAPADIVWVIDSSASMYDEAVIVQDNMNAFALDITDDSEVDYRVVVITDYLYVEMPGPLGDDEYRYLFVPQAIASGSPLEQLLAQYSRYAGFLRAASVTHLIAVSDDDSDLPAEEFLSAMEDRLGKSFVFHAIASEDAEHDCVFNVCEPGCTGPNGAASDIGEEYYDLADMTGGQKFSICTSDWTGLFETLKEAVILISELPCYFELPDPPGGMVFDSELVDVVFTEGSEQRALARAMTRERCGDELAWYYDDNQLPSVINLCDAACETVSSTVTGSIDIGLGCAPDVILY